MKPILFFCLFLSSFAFAEINTKGSQAKSLWESVNTIAQIEKIQLIESDENKESFLIDTISCIYENYYACTFYARKNLNQEFVIATEGAEKFIGILAQVGIQENQERPAMDVDKIFCQHYLANDTYECTLVEFIRPNEPLL